VLRQDSGAYWAPGERYMQTAANLISQPFEDFKENFNEYRNDFGYRLDCVPAWWRRVVLGSRPRLTRPGHEERKVNLRPLGRVSSL
jgi:hypothetical protein